MKQQCSKKIFYEKNKILKHNFSIKIHEVIILCYFKIIYEI